MRYSTIRHRFADHCGVYSIVNLSTGRTYVGGTSLSFRRRWIQHLARLRNGTHHCRLLQVDYDRDGPDGFTFDVLEITLPADARKREQIHLDRLRSEGVLVYGEMEAFLHRHNTPLRDDDTLFDNLADRFPDPV